MAFTEEEKQKFIRECDRRRAAGYAVWGPLTFKNKDAIRQAGGIWDGKRKAWLFQNAEDIQKIFPNAEYRHEVEKFDNYPGYWTGTE